MECIQIGNPTPQTYLFLWILYVLELLDLPEAAINVAPSARVSHGVGELRGQGKERGRLADLPPSPPAAARVRRDWRISGRERREVAALDLGLLGPWC